MLKRYKEKAPKMREQQRGALVQSSSTACPSPTLPSKVLRLRQRSISKKSKNGSSVVIHESRVASSTSPTLKYTEPDHDAAFDDRKITRRRFSAQSRNAPLPASPARHTDANDQQELWNRTLQEASTFLGSLSPCVGYGFARRHRLIQEFLQKLSKQKEGSFDENLYDDVQSWLDKRASETEPERQWDFLDEDPKETDSTVVDGHTPSLAQHGEEGMSDSDEPTSSAGNTAGEPQLLLAETVQLQHIMSNEILKDLSGEAYKPTVPMTVKLALPQPSQSTVEEIEGYLAAEIENAGYAIAPAEPLDKGKRKRDNAKGHGRGNGKRKRSGDVVNYARLPMDDLINEEEELVNGQKPYARQDAGNAMMSGALQV